MDGSVPAPTGLQGDLLSALVRIMQIQDEQEPDDFLWGRLVTCDVPRLTGHLTPETIAWYRQEHSVIGGSWRP